MKCESAYTYSGLYAHTPENPISPFYGEGRRRKESLATFLHTLDLNNVREEYMSAFPLDEEDHHLAEQPSP